MHAVFLIVGHLKHDRKVKFSLNGLIFISNRFDIVWHKSHHTLNWHIDSEDVIKIVIVFDSDHYEPLLRCDMCRIEDQESLVPLRIVGVDD